MTLTPKQKIHYCLIGNLGILLLITGLTTFLAEESSYWRYGWHPDLIMISVKINSARRYIGLLLLIGAINVSQVIIRELGMPVLGFSIFNPDKKIITEFTKNELQFYANAMYLISGLCGLFSIFINLSQIDIAAWGVLTSEGASFFTIRILLNEKTFGKKDVADMV